MATRVKRYEAPLEQFDALLARIETEMGPDARLETREFRRGSVMGMGGTRMVEVIASVTVDVMPPSAPRNARGPAPMGEPAGLGGRSGEPRWARPGISIQADDAALPQASQPQPAVTAAQHERSPGNSAHPGLLPAPRLAPLLSDYQGGEQRRQPAQPQPPAADSRLEQQFANLKRELSRLQSDPGSGTQLQQPRQVASQRQPQQEIEDLRATVAELSASIRQLQAEKSAALKASASTETVLESGVADAALRSGQGRLVSQGGGPATVSRSIAQPPQRPADAEPPMTDWLAEDSVAQASQLSAPGSAVLSDEDAEANNLWELVEPVKAPLFEQAPGALAAAASDEELSLPQLPSMTQPGDGDDSARQVGQIKHNAYLRLLNSNIDSDNAMQLVERAATQLGNHMRFDDARPELVEEALLTEIQGEICRDILIGGGIELRGGLPGRVVALVGPTGVGKTTCIAKLAAHFAFQRGRSVGLVSLDTYRIAAAEQLKTYAEIMGLPIQVVYSADELDSALQASRARHELTLVDTAGASPLGGKQLLELGKAFSLHSPDEVHLVLSATTKADDLRLLLENFRMLNYSRLILSKLDETRGLGALYNVNRYASAPISYFAVGQGVPEDLRVAELDFIQHWVTTGAVK
ncbi:hypothetical protein IT575_05710 [bacterium]|nr:hypothetical protein [bacterium]